MPELAGPKGHVHPFKRPGKKESGGDEPLYAPAATGYAELAVTSNFTFLTGASHPDELMIQAAGLGYRAIALTDHNSLAGVVRAHVAAKEAGIRFIVGCRLRFVEPEWLSLLVYPTDRAAYGRLCRLLTLGKRRAPKGECHLFLEDLEEYGEGMVAVAMLESGAIGPPSRAARRDGAPAERSGVSFSPEQSGALSSPARSGASVSPEQSRASSSTESPEQSGALFSPEEVLARLARVFDDDRLSLAMARLYGPEDPENLAAVVELARRTGVPLVAVNDVYYHMPQRRILQDTLVCIRHTCTLAEAGFRLFPNGERYLKPPDEMARLFADHPEALSRSLAIAERAGEFSLDQLRYEYPHEICPPGLTPMAYLRDLVWHGAAQFYPQGVPEKVRMQIEHEFALIEELEYASYFLTVHDLVRFARSRDILCQGRGAAANSAVCFCLGVTSVDPDRIDMLFERFVSRERNEPPDIDIDFEHERREEVIQYIYQRYGRDRAGLTAEVISYRSRSAIRDVGKALGLSLDAVDRMAKRVSHWSHQGLPEGNLADAGFASIDSTLALVLKLVNEIIGFPRHLSQHVGGFVITRGLLCDLVPIENAAMAERTVIEWDKDDIDALGMLKVDVLGLGMLTCVRKAMEFVNALEAPQHEVKIESGFTQRRKGAKEEKNLCAFAPLRETSFPLQFHSIPAEDPRVYDMICKADTVGVFQIESRAQMTMLPRLKPRNFYDLVIEVAIVRPGPIVGDMVHPFLRRRNGEEKVTYPDAKIEKVLRKTLGIPLFQEQAMSLAIVGAGFTPGEAERLRRAINAWKSRGKDVIPRYRVQFIEGMVGNGYDRSFAEQCFNRLQGFSEYGFPESHSASFALIVYASAWLKCHYPAAFAAALLNSQPMGFYAPAQIVRDARDHGVPVRAVDVNHSAWDCTLEHAGEASTPNAGKDACTTTGPARSSEGPALRLGMRLIKGLREADAHRIAEAVRKRGRIASVVDVWRASEVSASALTALAQADAFGSMGLDRQQALWAVKSLRGRPLPLFDAAWREPEPQEEAAPLPDVAMPVQVVRDYHTIGLSLKAHPISFLREELQRRRILTAAEVRDERCCPHGRTAAVAGLVLFRQRPSTAGGVLFMTLEDETGRADLILRPAVTERFSTAVLFGRVLIARGRVERQGLVVHVLVRTIEEIDYRPGALPSLSRDFR